MHALCQFICVYGGGPTYAGVAQSLALVTSVHIVKDDAAILLPESQYYELQLARLYQGENRLEGTSPQSIQS